jgi:hypothetical protein
MRRPNPVEVRRTAALKLCHRLLVCSTPPAPWCASALSPLLLECYALRGPLIEAPPQLSFLLRRFVECLICQVRAKIIQINKNPIVCPNLALLFLFLLLLHHHHRLRSIPIIFLFLIAALLFLRPRHNCLDLRYLVRVVR